MRVERRDDRPPDGRQQVVEVADDGAVLGAVFEEFFTLEDRGVVLFDLRGDGAVGHRRHGGNEFSGLRGVVEVAADELRDVDLVVEREPFGLVLGAFRDASGGLGGDVDHLVVLLEVLDVLVNVSEFASDDFEPGLDEFGGRDRNAPFVVDCVFFVGVDQGVEDIFGPLRDGVVHRDGDDGGLFVGDVALDGIAVCIGRRLEGAFAHQNGHSVVCGVHVEGLADDDLPDGRRDGVSVVGGDDAAALLFGYEFVVEFGELDLLFAGGRDRHRERLVVVVVDERDVDGDLSVEVFVPESFVDGVVDG